MSTEITLIPAEPQPLGSRLASAADNVARYLKLGLEGADNTVLAYSADLKSFGAYCAEHGLCPLPADVATVARYVADLADLPRKLSTIKRHLAAIHKHHQLRGYPSPVHADELALVLDGITRALGKRQKQAPAFTVEELKESIRRLDVTTTAGLRDRALLLLGFAGAFRRSELVALDVEHLEFTERALIVHLPKSKTNQAGEAEDKAVFYAPSAEFCPVRCVRAWVKVLGQATGPLFVSLRRGKEKGDAYPTKQRLSPLRVNLLVQQHLNYDADGLQIQGRNYSAHSLRVSFITIAVVKGQSNRAIKNQTKQKTDAMIDRYSRLDDVVTYNAAQSLGL
ncbi:tyrosine-type recombinase/integrase [Hymenobacter properus]|uniref:Tyrosine-type recombinase/integrase n=1 Tax=Hymenobacter properus TaxID=2791026 RepID=A0A931BKY5_9BACT|nr:tyrosine-type recombinase/integrase [Hymenobacter properus]MBF9144516.1 tyrosine-type recombinase/integrase [Hymenobacter properus]MBR7723334.1 tyrosine-type recombinase/integrase [Microvirga sp. SRT04]